MRRAHLRHGILFIPVSLAAAGAAIAPLAGLAIASVAAAVAVLVIPELVPVILLAASVLNRVSLGAGGAAVRLDLLVGVFLGLILVSRFLLRTIRWKNCFTAPAGWFALYLAVNVASTVLFGAEKSRGLKLDLEITAALMAFLVALASLNSPRELERVLRAMWVITTLEALVGVLAAALSFAGVTQFGVQAGSFGLPMAYGTTYEANIFGSLLMGNFILLAADFIGGPKTALRTVCLTVVLLGVGASLTRTVWLSLALGLFILLAFGLRRYMSHRMILMFVAGGPVLVLAGLLGGAATPLAGRILDIVNIQSSSAVGRFTLFNAALEEWRRSPWFGLGTGSFNWNASPGQPHPWIPNLTVLTLHDTGIVGLTVLVILVISFFRQILPGCRTANRESLWAVGAGIGFGALLVSFQSTTGFWFVYPWLLAAIAVRSAQWAVSTR